MAQSRASARLILGVTRLDDQARGMLNGLIIRDGETLRHLDLKACEQQLVDTGLFKLEPATGGLAQRVLDRLEFTVSGKPRCLFRQADGTLRHDDLFDKLQFSSGKKALLKPQALPLPVESATVEYLEISRLSDSMRKDMLMGERSVAQLCEVLGLGRPDTRLEDTLWNLGRQGWISLFESGDLASNALSLPRPVPALKG